MRPATVTLDSHTRGDTWEGMNIGPVVINNNQPPSPAASCRMQFRDKTTGELGFELNTTGGAGIGDISIDNATTWVFSIPPQILDMPASKYVWDFEVTDGAGVIRTLYGGKFTLVNDVTRD